MNAIPNGFSKYLVIFLDILGSKNRVDFQEAYLINNIFFDELDNNRKNDMLHTVYERKIYSFSDCAYIFYGFKNNVLNEKKDVGKLFTVALCNCEPLFLRFLKEKLVFRGGISYGDAYIDPKRNMFFGPAVNAAYTLESTVAVHPRIIIEPIVAQAVIDNIKQVKYNLVPESLQGVLRIGAAVEMRMPETGEGIVEKDIDGQYVFNYLHFPENNFPLLGCYSSCKAFLEEQIHYIYTQINENIEYRVLDKYFYLLRFFENKLNNLLEISLP